MRIDATGGVIKRSSKDKKMNHQSFYISVCLLILTEVFQMISVNHKSMHIAYFLRKIISKSIQAPRMVVCDFGWAILIAEAEIFAVICEII